MRKIIVILGIGIALLPFLGFPRAVEDFFLVIAGLGIAFAAYYGNHGNAHNENVRMENNDDGRKEMHRNIDTYNAVE